MFKTGDSYTGFAKHLTESLLGKTDTENKGKAIDEAILDVALLIHKDRHELTKKRLEINGHASRIEAADLEKRIANYTANLEDIFKRCGLSSKEGYNLLHKMQDDQLFK
jgi:hypothetical protein